MNNNKNPQESCEYSGDEKRRQGRTIADVEAAFDRKLAEHAEQEKNNFVALVDAERIRTQGLLEQLKSEAFPDGPTKHGEYHLAKINSAKEEAEFWKAAKMELTKGGVSAILWVIKTVLILAGIGLLYKVGLGGLTGIVLPK